MKLELYKNLKTSVLFTTKKHHRITLDRNILCKLLDVPLTANISVNGAVQLDKLEIDWEEIRETTHVPKKKSKPKGEQLAESDNRNLP